MGIRKNDRGDQQKLWLVDQAIANKNPAAPNRATGFLDQVRLIAH
jgi:hypothetical protein